MPILPLDHPEPSFATRGVMLYPATDEADTLKARAYVAQVLAKAFRRFQEKGGVPPFETLGPIYLDAGEPLDDLEERWWGGRATGEVFKTLFALANTDPPLASWKHAIQIVEETAKRNNVKGGRTKLLQAKDRFLSVAAEIEGVVVRSVRDHLNQSEEIEDAVLITTHVVRIEVQSDQLVIELTNAKGIGSKRLRSRSMLKVSWHKTPLRRRRGILVPGS